MDKIHFIITGGTIDSVYNPPTETAVPATKSVIENYINETIAPYFDCSFETLCMLDSGNITNEHRSQILESIHASNADKIIITHGTNTLVETAQYLKENYRYPRVNPWFYGLRGGFATITIPHGIDLNPGVLAVLRSGE